MSKHDYYQTLEVSRGASAEAIKKAYRRLAKRHHPDHNPGDQKAEQRFKDINEAYDILSDPTKRAAYDQHGHSAFESGRRTPGGDYYSFTTGFGGFSDIFSEVFSEFMAGNRPSQRGHDLRYDLDITLEDAFRGKQASIRVKRRVTCDTCQGQGSRPGSAPTVCATCQGNGRVQSHQGFMMFERICSRCKGTGYIVKYPCTSCHGEGRRRREKNLQVTIPPGVEDGMKVRLKDEGEITPHGLAGDLYIFIRVASHGRFQRQGRDLLCQHAVSIVEAALGTTVVLPNLVGEDMTFDLPAGSQTGQQFRIKQQGMPDLNGNLPGDCYVEIVVKTPVGLTARQKDLLQEFANEEAIKETAPPDQFSRGFFSKFKDWWRGLKSRNYSYEHAE